MLGPLGNGFRLDVERPLLVGGGIGVAPFPYLSERSARPPAVLGFRSDWHAEAAALVPNAEVVVEPTLVTEPLADLERVTTSSRAARSRCSRPCGSSRRTPSSPGRRRWPAATAPATAARRDRRRAPAPLRRGPVPGGRVMLNASGCLRCARGARGRARPRRVRDEDRHAAAARGQPPGADRRDRPRDAELDRAREPGHRRLPRRQAAAAGRARRAALGVRRRVRSRRTTRALRRARRPRRGRRDRAQPLVPERRGGARERRRDRRRGAGGRPQAALREALAGRARPRRDGARGPGRGRRRPLARQHDPRPRARRAHARSRRSGPSSAATPGPR